MHCWNYCRPREGASRRQEQCAIAVCPQIDDAKMVQSFFNSLTLSRSHSVCVWVIRLPIHSCQIIWPISYFFIYYRTKWLLLLGAFSLQIPTVTSTKQCVWTLEIRLLLFVINIDNNYDLVVRRRHRHIEVRFNETWFSVWSFRHAIVTPHSMRKSIGLSFTSWCVLCLCMRVCMCSWVWAPPIYLVTMAQFIKIVVIARNSRSSFSYIDMD